MSYSEDTIDFLHQGDLIGMQNSLAKALKNDNSEMLADLAEYLQMMGFIDESQKIYDQVMSEDPETTDYLINLAEILISIIFNLIACISIYFASYQCDT